MTTYIEILTENQIAIEDKNGNKYPMGVLAIDTICVLTEKWLEARIQKLIETKDQDNLNLFDGAVAVLEELIYELHLRKNSY